MNDFDYINFASFLYPPSVEGKQIKPEEEKINELIHRLIAKHGRIICIDDTVIDGGLLKFLKHINYI